VRLDRRLPERLRVHRGRRARPPTALCESRDPEATCPAGYDTKVLYGQIFCKPPAPVAAGAPAGRSDTRRQTAGL